MSIDRNKSQRPWLIIGIAIILLTVGTGFYQNLSAENEETYKGLKIFSDVIELIQKNYVDPVDTQKLIEKAIQPRSRPWTKSSRWTVWRPPT